MKKTLWQPMAVGLAALLLAMPVYAENTQAPDEAAAPAAQTAPAQKEENRLAPYLGKKITKQTIAGNVAISEEEIAAALKTKQGMEFTEEGLSLDLSAIYDLGWFYDMHPEFKLVPEGVQVIYHVLENPVYKDVKVNGKRASAEAMLSAGDELTLYISQEDAQALQKPPRQVRAKKQFVIAYEDENILAAEKPFGLLTHGDRTEKKNHLANQVLDYLVEKGE